MFDTMTLTKAMGGFCGALLVFLLGGWAAEIIYHSSEGGHGEDHAAAYVFQPVETTPVAAEPVEAVPFAELLASADAGAGERLFQRNCSACHAVVDGENKAGPYLSNIVGREVASATGFNYSGALAAVVDVWTEDELSAFIEAPSDYAPGTVMGYNGMREAEDRANLIAYLDTLE